MGENKNGYEIFPTDQDFLENRSPQWMNCFVYDDEGFIKGVDYNIVAKCSLHGFLKYVPAVLLLEFRKAPEGCERRMRSVISNSAYRY